MISTHSSLLEKFPGRIGASRPANKFLTTSHPLIQTHLNTSSRLLAGLELSAKRPLPSSETSGKHGKRTRSQQKEEELPAKGVFKNKIFYVEFALTTPFHLKQKIRSDITANGGTYSHILRKEVDAVILADSTHKESYKCKRALDLSIPVLDLTYITDSIAQGSLKHYDDYMIFGQRLVNQLQSGKISGNTKSKAAHTLLPSSVDWKSFPSYTDDRYTGYIDEPKRYRVPKWAFQHKKNGELCVLEIHVLLTDSDKKEFKVTTQHYPDMKKESSSTEVREANGPFQAELLFASLCAHNEYNLGYSRMSYIPVRRGSPKLIQALFTWATSCRELTSMVKSFVHTVWADAVGEVAKHLSIPLSDLSKATVEQAEGILIEIKENFKESRNNSELVKEFYSILPCQDETHSRLDNLMSISKKFCVLQLLYDLLSVGEATDWNLECDITTKLRSLNCHVAECEKQNWPQLVKEIESGEEDIVISEVFAVARPTEHLPKDGKQRQLLYHSSSRENYLGILSRGLLLPKHVVEDFGGKRTDAGDLGNGIYFADDFRTSHRFSSCSSDNSRLMLVCEVVTGSCFTTTAKMPGLVEPPTGYDSVMAEGGSRSGDFKSNEYCVYSTKQQALRYVIRYTTRADREAGVKALTDSSFENIEDSRPWEDDKTATQAIIDDVSDIKLADVLPGLQVEGDNQVPIPLSELQVGAKLVDTAAEVVVLQRYRNESPDAIEAKFVFPLTEMAAVCGFEAFINNKHIVGEVKEKEKAQKEYRQAVSEGHGAYLMVQDKERPDVFTVSVGNLPPYCTVLIKITYVCELSVSDGKFTFELPTNIAPWNSKQALAAATQSTLQKIGVDSSKMKDVTCGVQVSVQMPFDIQEICSPTHNIFIKKTQLQAMVEMQPDQSLADGFVLTISLAEIHVPRMIIEKHTDRPESEQACMLTFYPEFDCATQANYEMIIMLDLSNSMSADELSAAKKVTLVLLSALSKSSSFNLIAFGSTYDELFQKSMPASRSNISRAISYIQTRKSRQGNTDLLTPLSNISILTDTCRHRNVVVISDGHITHPRETLQAVSSMYGTIRLFTLALSANANRFIMRELARVGSGTMEYLNSSSKSKWYKQIKEVVEKAGEPLLSQVKVIWQEQNTDMPAPLQAPASIPSVFNGNRIVVYGFASNCFMATLQAVIDGREVSTVVSASPITASTGLTIHRLAARAVIQDWENGCLSTDSVEHELLKKKQKASIIEMSKEYSIITQFTSFVAVEKRGEEPESQLTSELTMAELLMSLQLDLLPYMAYDHELEEDGLSESSIESSSESSSESSIESSIYCMALDDMEMYDAAVMDCAEETVEDYEDCLYGVDRCRDASIKARRSAPATGKPIQNYSSQMSQSRERRKPRAMKVCDTYWGDSMNEFEEEYEELNVDRRWDAPPKARRSAPAAAVSKDDENVHMNSTDSLPSTRGTEENFGMTQESETTLPMSAQKLCNLAKQSESFGAKTSAAPLLIQGLDLPVKLSPSRVMKKRSSKTTGFSPQIKDAGFDSQVSNKSSPVPNSPVENYGQTCRIAMARPQYRASASLQTQGMLFGAAPPPLPPRVVPSAPPPQDRVFSLAPSSPQGVTSEAPPPLPSRANAFAAIPPPLPPQGTVGSFASTPQGRVLSSAPTPQGGVSSAAPSSSQAMTSEAPPPPPLLSQANAFAAVAPPLLPRGVSSALPPQGGVSSAAVDRRWNAPPKARGSAPVTAWLSVYGNTNYYSKPPPLPPRVVPSAPPPQDRVFSLAPSSPQGVTSEAPPPYQHIRVSSAAGMTSGLPRPRTKQYSNVSYLCLSSHSEMESKSEVKVMELAESVPQGMTSSLQSVTLKTNTASKPAEQVQHQVMNFMSSLADAAAMSQCFPSNSEMRLPSTMKKRMVPRLERKRNENFQEPEPVTESMEFCVDDSYGIYQKILGGEVHLRISYARLTDFKWNESLHLIGCDLDESAPSPIFSPVLYQQTDSNITLIESYLLATKKVEKFNYKALEELLIDAGVLSLGKTAAAEIVCIFLWKIATFLEHVARILEECDVGKKTSKDVESGENVQKLLRMVSSEDATIASSKWLLDKYPNLLRRLELGSSWSHLLLNMMCTAHTRQLVIRLKKKETII
ncbi:protein mono-ADP-ribosyltransferase PARP4-like [Watersipora subatra]|uniref:protein mono-ADP-ribosyltransferase PARP4-like n=1 Tax=Watersipora subatra TaxID=2589382 RepID=UPI00355C451E